MDGGEERRGGNFDDLFEDLDHFFQPGEQGPEEIEGAGPAPEAPGSPPAGSEEDRRLEEADTSHDILRPDGTPDVGSFDSSSREEDPESPHGEDAPPRDQGEHGPESDPGTGEEEWSRLRDVLDDRDQPDLPSYPFSTESSPPTAGDPLFDFLSAQSNEPGMDRDHEVGSSGRPEEESPGLTIEDVKKAPPEYRDLPGADLGGAGGSGSTGAGSEDPDAEEGPVLDELFGEEPDIADVELAADQLAREFAPPDGTEELETGADDEEEEDLAPPPPPRRTVQVREPESLTGPTWEEPTSRVITNERQGPRTSEGRNLPAAIFTAVGLAVVLVASILIRTWLFTVVAGAVVLLGQFELYTTMQRRGFKPASALGLVIGGLMGAAAYGEGERALLAMVGLAVAASFLWYMASGVKGREGTVRDLGATLLGIVYGPLLASFYVIILTQAGNGRSLVLGILGVTFLYDAVAYFSGSLFGSRALAPTISPKKSWEGLVGATAVALLVGGLILSNIDPLDYTHAVGLALVISVFAPLGDLAESMMKRDLGVKDMGSVLPGHGGILDRIDSALFVGVAAFYYLRIFYA